MQRFPLHPIKNVLLIISDQHRQDAMSHLGNTDIKTPHLDKLASVGVSFSKAISPAPLCGPARAALFSGLYPHQARGVLEEEALGARDDMDWGVETDMMVNTTSLREEPLLTRPFRENGYYTAYAGKWHLGNDILTDWFSDAKGCDNQDYVNWLRSKGLPETGWPLKDKDVRSQRTPPMSIPRTKVSPINDADTNDAWITDIALNYLKQRPVDRPFFITCGFNGPHPPFMIPEPWYSMYDPATIPEPGNFKPSAGEPDCKAGSFYRQLWLDHGDDWSAWKKSVAVYWGFVSYIDHQVGRLLEELERQGVRDETLIIYTSDHGEMLGSHGLWHKMQAYEESLRVPLIIDSPSGKAGGISSAPVSLLDIAPTILSQCGQTIPESYQGEDLTNLLDNPESVESRTMFAEQSPLGKFHGEKDWRMVLDEDWKFIWNRNDRCELYHLGSDPDERFNHYGESEHRGISESLRGRLIEWMIDTSDPLAAECQSS
jgi:arylsulfatase A-like enzyme